MSISSDATEFPPSNLMIYCDDKEAVVRSVKDLFDRFGEDRMLITIIRPEKSGPFSVQTAIIASSDDTQTPDF